VETEIGTLPPHCPEAERGVLGCCLLDTTKTAVALKAGVNTRWFSDLRHAEVFSVLTSMAANGGGDSVTAANSRASEVFPISMISKTLSPALKTSSITSPNCGITSAAAR
jgi:DnaB-like helicase N terminal domain